MPAAERYTAHTTSFNTNWVNGRILCISLGARQLLLVREQDTDEDSPLAGEFNGEFNGKENSQTNGFEHTIKSSILTNLIFRKRAGEERH
jgi:hypothetical protein